MIFLRWLFILQFIFSTLLSLYLVQGPYRTSAQQLARVTAYARLQETQNIDEREQDQGSKKILGMLPRDFVSLSLNVALLAEKNGTLAFSLAGCGAIFAAIGLLSLYALSRRSTRRIGGQAL